MEKNFDWRDSFDFVTCQRADGTFYGNGGGQCRLGVEAKLPAKVFNHPVHERLGASQSKELNVAFEAFGQVLEDAGYQEDALEDWAEAQAGLLTELNTEGGHRGTRDPVTKIVTPKPYTPDEIIENAKSQLKTAETDMVNKAPTHVDTGTGNITPASLGTVPVMRAKQMSWEDPVLDGKYMVRNTQTKEQAIKNTQKEIKKFEKKNDATSVEVYKNRLAKFEKLPDGSRISTANQVSLSKFSRWQEGTTEKMLSYKEKQEAAGKPWPTPRGKEPSKAEVDALVKANPKMWAAGFNIQNAERGRDDGFDVYGIGSKSPTPAQLAAREQRNRDVGQSYLAYGRRSPMTGELIKPPKSSLPTTKTTVDHVEAITVIKNRNPGISALKLNDLANNTTNFQVIEFDINDAKNSRSIEDTVATLKKTGTDSSVRKSVTDRWNDRGSKVTLSRKQYEETFGTTRGFDSPAARQQIASAYEQRRLARAFGAKTEDMVPTQKSTRNSPPVSKGFTPPAGQVLKPIVRTSRPAPAPASNRSRTSTATSTLEQTQRSGKTDRQKLEKKQQQLRNEKKELIDRARTSRSGKLTASQLVKNSELAKKLRDIEAKLS